MLWSWLFSFDEDERQEVGCIDRKTNNLAGISRHPWSCTRAYEYGRLPSESSTYSNLFKNGWKQKYWISCLWLNIHHHLVLSFNFKLINSSSSSQPIDHFTSSHLKWMFCRKKKCGCHRESYFWTGIVKWSSGSAPKTRKGGWIKTRKRRRWHRGGEDDIKD